jgi:ATP-dependent helicase HrpA
VPPGEEPLLDALERHLRATTGVVVPRDAWDWAKVPAHLRPTIRVVDEDGSVRAAGKDLAVLKAPLTPQVEDALAEAAGEVTATGQTTWTFGTVPATSAWTRAGHEVRAYPALVDEGESVGLQVLGSADDAAAVHRHGVRRLLRLAVRAPDLAAGLGNAEKLQLAGSPYPSGAGVLSDVVLAAVEELMHSSGGPVRDRAAFDAMVAQVRGGLPDAARAVLATVLRVLDDWRRTDRQLSGSASLPLLPALADMRAQVGRLVYRGFVADVGASRLAQLPRYLDAVRVRRERLETQVAADRALMDRVLPLQEAYLHRLAGVPGGRPPPAGLVRVRWLLEEYRVSLWAQHLGTAEKVSDARVRRALEEL